VALRRSVIRAYSAAVWEGRAAQQQLAERGEMSRISESFSARFASQKKSRGMDFGLSLVDPRAWFQLFRLVHYYNYDHVRPLRVADIGQGVRMAPNVSLRNGERIKIGDFSHIGARCSLWAGDSVGRITLGRYALLGPEVFITASNYRTEPGTPVMNQPRVERDVVVGDDVWLGARVVVVAGVEIGAGCIIGASSVVTRSITPGSIAVGNPARVVGRRGDRKGEAQVHDADAPLGASGAM
jgi:acetyltransferase-like isoleucine patch superfamily enzyme